MAKLRLKKLKAQIFYLSLIIIVVSNVAYWSGAVNYLQTQINPYFTDTFYIPLSVASGASGSVIRCTVTNNLYYDDINNNKILYSSVPANLPAGSFLKYQGATAGQVTGYDVDITAFCDPIPQAVQNAVGVNYNAFYLTGGTLKDTFLMKGTLNNKNGITISQDNVQLPPNTATCACTIFGGKIRMDGQGIIHLYQKHFNTSDMQNTFGPSPDQTAVVDNAILYNLQFQVTSSIPNNSPNYVWNTNWGDEVTMQIWINGNQQSTPPTSTASTSKVENLNWISPSVHSIDESVKDPSQRTITFSVVLPQYTAGEGTPSVSVYYTNAVNGMTNTSPISVIQLANPTIDSTATATFTGTFTQDPFSNTGTWKLVLNPALDTNGNPKRNDPTNTNFLYYSVTNSQKVGQTTPCTPPSVTTIDGQGNQYCANPTSTIPPVNNSTTGNSNSASSGSSSSSSSTTPPPTTACPSGWTGTYPYCIPPYQQPLLQFVQMSPYLAVLMVIIVAIAIVLKKPIPRPTETFTAQQ